MANETADEMDEGVKADQPIVDEPTRPPYRNAAYNRFGTIDMEIEHPVYGWLPFTAAPSDVEPLGRDLFLAAVELGSVAAYVAPPPPTPEEARAQMPRVTRRQLRLALVRNGYSLTAIAAAIAEIGDEQLRDEATIDWNDATDFGRLDSLLLLFSSLLAISETVLDTIWSEALAIS